MIDGDGFARVEIEFDLARFGDGGPLDDGVRPDVHAFPSHLLRRPLGEVFRKHLRHVSGLWISKQEDN